MKQKLKVIFSGPIAFYPLLFAAFPILFLYAHNISQTSASEIWMPLGISVGAAVVLWVALSFALGSLAKAAFATAIFQVLFFSYGRFYDVLASWGLPVANHAILLPVSVAIWGCCVCFIGRAKRDFRIITMMLNIAAVILIAINLLNIASYQVKQTAQDTHANEEAQQGDGANPTEQSTAPDIYLIIMDEYAHPDTMLEWFAYDNSEFIDNLEDEGFFIASDSQTQSGKTAYILAGVLNLEYPPTGEPEQSELYRMIAYNRAAEFLRTRGYSFIYFGNVYDFGRWYTLMKDSADHYFNYFEGSATPWISEFQEILWNTTMLKPFYYRLVAGHYEEAQRRQILYTLEHLKALPHAESPKFVVTHLYSPHVPFVFGPEGEHVTAVNWENYDDRQFYLGQYIFISAEIEKLVNVLLEESQTPPIIIVQSDHGLRTHGSDIVGSDEWRKILNVMYLPGVDYSELSNSMSPYNTLRFVFSQYFDADYILMEDR